MYERIYFLIIVVSKLVLELISIIEEKIGKSKDLSKHSLKEKIDIAAHLNFLQILLEDFFMIDEDFEDFEYSEEAEEDEK